jgi:hypothetical protein
MRERLGVCGARMMWLAVEHVQALIVRGSEHDAALPIQARAVRPTPTRRRVNPELHATLHLVRN